MFIKKRVTNIILYYKKNAILSCKILNLWKQKILVIIKCVGRISQGNNNFTLFLDGKKNVHILQLQYLHKLQKIWYVSIKRVDT